MRLSLGRLPETLWGDAAHAAILGILFAALFTIADGVIPGGDDVDGWTHAGSAAVIYALCMFAWLRWTHRRKRRADDPIDGI